MTFGKRVLGDALHAAQAAQKKARRAKGIGLGKRVTGVGSPTAVKEADEPEIKLVTDTEQAEPTQAGVQDGTDTGADAGDHGAEGSESDGAEGGEDNEAGDGGEGSEEASDVVTMSIAEIDEALNENPAAFDSIFEAELNRPEGAPRKGALRLLLKVEQAREGGARPEIVKEIGQHLKRD